LALGLLGRVVRVLRLAQSADGPCDV